MTAAMGRIARRVGSAVAATLLAAGVVAWPVGFRRTVALAAFGPEGRPIAVFSSSGAFHLLIATVPTGPAMAWRLDGRTDSRESFDQRHDQIVTAADWCIGDRVVTPTGPAGPTTTVAHGRLGLAPRWRTRCAGPAGHLVRVCHTAGLARRGGAGRRSRPGRPSAVATLALDPRRRVSQLRVRPPRVDRPLPRVWSAVTTLSGLGKVRGRFHYPRWRLQPPSVVASGRRTRHELTQECLAHFHLACSGSKDAGSDVPRRPGLLAVRSGSSGYLRHGATGRYTGSGNARMRSVKSRGDHRSAGVPVNDRRLTRGTAAGCGKCPGTWRTRTRSAAA